MMGSAMSVRADLSVSGENTEELLSPETFFLKRCGR